MLFLDMTLELLYGKIKYIVKLKKKKYCDKEKGK